MATEREQVRKLYQEGSPGAGRGFVDPATFPGTTEEMQQVQDIISPAVTSAPALDPYDEVSLSSYEAVSHSKPRDPKVSSSIAGQMASLRSFMDPMTDMGTHYTRSIDDMEYLGEQEAIDKTLAEFNTYYKSLIQDMILQDIEDNIPQEGTTTVIDSTQEYAKDILDMMGENDELLSTPYGLEAANILAHKGQVSRGDLVIAERQLYRKTLKNIMEGTSTLEDIGNIAGMFWPDWRFDAQDLTKEGFFSAAQDLKQLAYNFQSLPLDQRIATFPHLAKDVIEASDGNELKAVSRLLQIFDPTQTEHIDLENALDAIDLIGTGALILSPLITAVTKTTKAISVTKTLSEIGDTKKAGELSSAGLLDETGQVAEAIGEERLVSAANGTPYRFSDNGLIESTQGLSPEVQKTIEATRKATQRELADVIERKGALDESGLTAAEKQLAQDKFAKSHEELQEAMKENQGWYISDAKVVEQRPDSFVVEYSFEGVPVKRRISYNKEDIDSNDVFAFDKGVHLTKFLAPDTTINRLRDKTVEWATRIGFQQPKALAGLSKAARTAFKGLNKESRTKVDNVLIAGDDANKGKGKVFTPDELQAIYRLSPREMGAYYASRDIFDALHFLKNTTVRRNLEFQGIKRVDVGGITAGSAKISMGRPYEQLSNATTVLNQSKVRRLWNANAKDGAGAIVDVPFVDLKKLYDEGFQLVKFRERQRIGKEYVNYGIVKSDQIQDLPFNVLNKKPGYIPKIYKDPHYFVKMEEIVPVDGSVGRILTTKRIFDNRADAEKWARAQQAAETDKAKTFHVIPDRELAVVEKDEEVINEMGGLFTSPRAKHEILYGLEGDTPARLDAIESMMRNISNISNSFPINEFRMGIQQRWLNSAKRLLENPGDFNSPPKPQFAGTKEWLAADHTRTWIRDQLRIPTQDELLYGKAMRGIAEWMEGKPIIGGKPRKFVMNIQSKDPFAALRAASFHTLLGALNPAQLWVQAQGAAAATSLALFSKNPVQALTTAAEYMGMRTAMFIDPTNEEAMRKIFASMREVRIGKEQLTMGYDEFKNMVQAFHRSGLKDAVVASQADYNAAVQGYGVSRHSIQSYLDKGLLFFKEGELYARGYSFIWSWKQWVKNNPGKVVNDDAIKEIVDHSVQLQYNLNRANRARWQKGVWSIPFQFQQITAKFAGNMFGSKGGLIKTPLTGAERAKIMLGQIMLFGAAGVPLGDVVTDNLLRMAGYEPGDPDLTPDKVAAISDGFWGWFTEMTIGEAGAFGDRGAPMSGITDWIKLFLYEDPSVKGEMLGALGTIVGPNARLPQAISKLQPLVTHPSEIEWTADEAKAALASVLDVVSSFNNIHKAWMWYKSGEVRDGKGQLLMNVDDEYGFLFLKAMGISPKRLQDVYAQKGWLLKSEEIDRTAAITLRKFYLDYYNQKQLSPESTRNLLLKEKWVFEHFGIEDPDRIQKIKQSVVGPLEKENRTKEQELLLKAIERHFETGETSFGGESLLLNQNLSEKVKENAEQPVQ